MTDDALEQVHALRADINANWRRFAYFIAGMVLTAAVALFGAVHTYGRIVERVDDNKKAVEKLEGSLPKILVQLGSIEVQNATIKAQTAAILRDISRIDGELIRAAPTSPEETQRP